MRIHDADIPITIETTTSMMTIKAIFEK